MATLLPPMVLWWASGGGKGYFFASGRCLFGVFVLIEFERYIVTCLIFFESWLGVEETVGEGASFRPEVRRTTNSQTRSTQSCHIRRFFIISKHRSCDHK